VQSGSLDAAICLACVGDDSLRSLLDDAAAEITCSSCQEKRTGISLAALAQRVDPFLRKYCEAGDTYPVFRGSDDRPDYEQEGESLVNLLEGELEIPYGVAEALADVLIADDPAWPPDGDEPFYTSEQNYVRSYVSTLPYAEEWSEFSDQIRHRRRFFDDEARSRLARILGDKGSDRAKELPVLEIGEGTRLPSIYRARIGETDADLLRMMKNPHDELRPPPPDRASAGRMNPVGIPVFYGACSKETTIAEVRPSVGGLVLACEFHISGHLRLLDLSRIGVAFSGSLFAPEYEDRASRAEFLRNFHRLIARPVHPNQEPLDYIPTQAVAEYVANVLGFDGILYASAQVGAVPDEAYHEHYINVEKLSTDELAQHNVVIFNDDVWSRTSSCGYAPHSRPPAKLSLVEDSVEAIMVTSVAYRYQQHYLRDGDDDDWFVIPRFDSSI
jgi:RES domain